MSLSDLAADADVTAEQVAEWTSLGLLHRLSDETFPPDAVARARLLRFATRRGLDEASLATAAEQQGDVLARYLQFLGAPSGHGRTIEQAGDELGLPAAYVRRLWIASGFGDEPRMFDDDVESFEGLQAAREAGLPDEALLQVARVFGDALGRVADLEVRLFHFYVHEQLRASGITPEEVSELTTQSGELLLELIEPAILYYHRKAWQRALREDVLLHLAEDVAAAGGPVGELTVAVLFVDLSDYTGLTDAMGDTAAVEVLDRFSDLVREAASENDGRIVKQIGDEFMLVLPDGAAAVRCGVDIAARASGEHEFPELRMGAHAGTVLYREADYLGATVNIAARATGQAERGQFVVTDAVRGAAEALPALRWSRIGTRELKGLRDPVELYLVAPREPRAKRDTDPVCGMELDPGRSVFSSTWNGKELRFCSERCQDRFAADPEHYVGA